LSTLWSVYIPLLTVLGFGLAGRVQDRPITMMRISTRLFSLDLILVRSRRNRKFYGGLEHSTAALPSPQTFKTACRA
jgi:hypothetical protein